MGGGGGYFNKFHESILVQSIDERELNVTAVNCKHQSHTHDL